MLKFLPSGLQNISYKHYSESNHHKINQFLFTNIKFDPPHHGNGNFYDFNTYPDHIYTRKWGENEVDKDALYEFSVGPLVLMSILYGMISLTSIIGNGCVIWIILSRHKMRTVTNYFLLNLAIADMVIGMFSVPFQFQAALLQRWVLPNIMCPLAPFVQTLCVNVSVLTLTIVALDRWSAVMRPLKPRLLSKNTAKIILILFWILSLLSSLPMALTLRIIKLSNKQMLDSALNVNASETFTFYTLNRLKSANPDFTNYSPLYISKNSPHKHIHGDKHFASLNRVDYSKPNLKLFSPDNPEINLMTKYQTKKIYIKKRHNHLKSHFFTSNTYILPQYDYTNQSVPIKSHFIQDHHNYHKMIHYKKRFSRNKTHPKKFIINPLFKKDQIRYLITTFSQGGAKYEENNLQSRPYDKDSSTLNYGTAVSRSFNPSYRILCVPIWPSDMSRKIYFIYLSLIQYFFPLSFMLCVYSRIAFKIWGRKAPGNALDARDNLINQNKKKVSLKHLIYLRVGGGVKKFGYILKLKLYSHKY
ncbi:unnamed protein product [Gordionus sp. m RMFG-2023]